MIIIKRLNTRYCDNYITNIVDMGNTISMCGTNAGSRKLYTFEKSKILFEKWINENSNVDVGARNVMNSIKSQFFVKVLATTNVGDYFMLMTSWWWYLKDVGGRIIMWLVEKKGHQHLKLVTETTCLQLLESNTRHQHRCRRSLACSENVLSIFDNLF